MIGRLWRGWTSSENAEAYEALLRTKVLPGIRALPGSRGAVVLRRSVAGEVEFVTLTRFDSLDAVRAFAGEEYEAAVVPQEARALLTRFDQVAVHYDLVIESI